MKKISIVLAMLAMAFASCTKDGSEQDGNKLATPVPVVDEASITETGFRVTWSNVENAGSYVYTVNDGEQKSMLSNSVTLSDLTASTSYTVKVKAVPSDNAYTESAWGTVTVTTAGGNGGGGNTPPAGDVHESLKGKNYVLVTLGEETKKLIPADRIAVDWRTDDVNNFNYVWEGSGVGGTASGPNAFGIVEGWNSLVSTDVWVGTCYGGYLVNDFASLNEWTVKFTGEEADKWYLHFALKSQQTNTIFAVVLYGGGEKKITIDGANSMFQLQRDGEWYHFDVCLKDLKDNLGLIYAGDYTKGENIVGYGVEGAVGSTIDLDGIFFYQK